MVCRRVCEKFQENAPLIPLVEIIEFVDANADLKRLVEPYVVQRRLCPDRDNECIRPVQSIRRHHNVTRGTVQVERDR